MRVSFSQTKNNDPEIRSGLKIPYAPGQRRVSKLLWWLIMTIVFAPFVILLWYVLIGWFFSSSPGVIAMNSFALRAPEKAYVKEILVKKGSDVSPGTAAAKLVRQPSIEILNQIALMKAERDSIKAGLQTMPKTPQRSLKLVDQNIAFFRKEAETMRKLMVQGAATRAEVNAAESRLSTAMSDREALLSVRVDDTPEKTMRARVDYFDMSIKYLEELGESSFDLLVRQAGRVQTIEVFPGQSVDAGDEIMWIADPGSASIVVFVEPENFKKIKLGSEVKVLLPGKSRTIKAILEEMPTVSQNTPGGLTSSISTPPRSVKVYLTPKEPLLKEELVEGLPVRVKWGLRSFF
ncbi:MAG: HlyD family efflux transporter periplasmic adaptor subunit [Synergistota bacterium]|nr:HlyD family efflux transporter periplasmic adaptor subunit [Synergistota bacterium]